MIQKYLNIISNYHKLRNEMPDTWLHNCKSQTNLTSAINCGALAQNMWFKRHPHQYRLKKVDLQLFADKLNQRLSNIQSTNNFDDLYNIIFSCRVSGIGALTVYDTANRIGEYLNLYPQFIYLHAGTKAGVQKLIGSTKANKINKQQLPEPFKSSNLSPAELEDILCIYKKLL